MRRQHQLGYALQAHLGDSNLVLSEKFSFVSPPRRLQNFLSLCNPVMWFVSSPLCAINSAVPHSMQGAHTFSAEQWCNNDFSGAEAARRSSRMVQRRRRHRSFGPSFTPHQRICANFILKALTGAAVREGTSGGGTAGMVVASLAD